jgi:hypothetical protein
VRILIVLVQRSELIVKDRLNFYTSDVQYAAEQVEGVDTYNATHLHPEIGRMQALSTYTSDQSKQEAKPWSGLALQHCEEQVLPGNLKDEDLSSIFEQCFESTNVASSAGIISDTTAKLASLLPPEHLHHSPRKIQNRNRRGNSRKSPKKNPGMDRSTLNADRHFAVSPPTSTASTNSTVSRGGRKEGYRLPEEDRISAKEVRDRGACLRCSAMKEKVHT